MENISVLEKTGRTSEKRVRTNMSQARNSSDNNRRNSVPVKNDSEVDENFLNYLTWHGLANEDKLLVLSSKLHYYYDYEELKEVTTLINLKKLNLIKHLDDFLQTLYSGLSPETNFIGCFSDRKTEKSAGMTSRFYKRFINFLDARIDLDIDRKDFSKRLESHGFKVMDMTEINGLTYFRTQNLSNAV
jgi:hypothetical protein